MAENSLGNKVPRAEYLTVPTPDPNGHDPASAPAVGPLAAAANAGMREGVRKALGVQSIQEAPPKDPSDAIIDAAGKLLTAARAQIAFHENRAKRLRDACAAFAAVSTPSAGAAPLSQADAITELLTIARHLPTPPEGNQS